MAQYTIAANTPPWRLYDAVWKTKLEIGKNHYEEPSPTFSCDNCGSAEWYMAQPRLVYYSCVQEEGMILLTSTPHSSLYDDFTPFFICKSCGYRVSYPQDRIIQYSNEKELIALNSTKVQASLGINLNEENELPYDEDPEPEEPF